VVGVMWMKGCKNGPPSPPSSSNGQVTIPATKPDGGGQTQQSVAAMPKLVDLGAGKCIPCKLMAPILDDLKKEYAGRLDVVFIDVWQNPDAGKQYGIKIIPTQIFYGADGKELFRHQGFFSKEDILKKWAELGVSFGAAPPTQSAGSEAKS
jgi:thioredoxin 1